jgi:putative tryptophan/tyrosine transport system substrate-binding protein
MASHIERRKFLAMLGGAAAWPLAARAQQPAGRIWRLGILQPGAPPEPLVEAIRQRLRELGYIEGRNIVLEYRWAEGKLERLTDLARDLVASKVDVITTMSTPAALAARNATTTIPIVFTAVGDPVGSGVVPSLARPGGNATGTSLLATELSAKINPSMVLRAQEAQDAATKLGLIVRSIGVHDLIDFDAAFAAIESDRADALLTLVDPFTLVHRKRIVDFAAQRHLPAIYEAREFVGSGGLVSYGPSLVANQRRAAEYVDKIFKGAKPADLPVEQPAKFELLINLKTAKALGLDIPPSVLARADEVIE